MWERNGKPVPAWSGNGWILDLQSRQVVWELSEAATTSGSRGAREFTGSMRLPAGSYTAFFASFPDGEYWSDDNAKKTGDRKWHWFGDEPVERFKLLVRGNGHTLTATETVRLAETSASTTVVALHGKFHEAFEQSGFILTKPTELHIAAEVGVGVSLAHFVIPKRSRPKAVIALPRTSL